MKAKLGVVGVVLGMLVMLQFQLAGGRVTAQSPATPTPTSGSIAAPPTLPPAQLLLAQAAIALRTAHSAHVKGSLAADVAGSSPGHLTLSMEGDVAWNKPQRGHLVGSLALTGLSRSPLPGSSANLELAFKKQRLALRIVGTPWQCSTVKGLASTTGVTVPIPTSNQLPIRFSNPVTVGAETIEGTGVWHVQSAGTIATGRQKGARTSGQPVHVDAYIAQGDNTLRRIALTGNAVSGKTTIAETLSADITRYNEPVRVTLPAACKVKVARGASLARSLPVRATLPLDPLKLVRVLLARPTL